MAKVILGALLVIALAAIAFSQTMKANCSFADPDVAVFKSAPNGCNGTMSVILNGTSSKWCCLCYGDGKLKNGTGYYNPGKGYCSGQQQ